MKSIFVMSGAVALAAFLVSGCEPAAKSGRGFKLPEGSVESGKTAFVDLKCYTCHTVYGVDDIPKPVDTVTSPVFIGGQVAKVKSYGDLVTSIIHPSHQITSELRGRWEEESQISPMPEFNHLMTVKQMIDLTTFLQSHYKKLEPLYDPYYHP